MAKKQKRRRGTGVIFQRGRTWAIRWVDSKRRRYEGGFETEDNARQALDVRIGDVLAGRIGKPVEPKRRTFDEVIDGFWDDRKDHRSLNDDKYRWKHLQAEIGHMHLQDVDDSMIEKLLRGLVKKTKPGKKANVIDLLPGTKARVLYLLSAFFRFAMREKHIAHNPVKVYLAGASRKQRERLKSKHDPKTTPYLPKEHVAAVYQALPADVGLAFAISTMAGLRPGEVVSLEWTDVDLKKGEINVQRNVRAGKVGPPKNGKPRPVPIVPGLAALLRARQRDTGLVVPPRGKAKWLGERAIDTAFTAAFKKLRLPDLTFYNAGRHSFASNWMASGNDIYRLRDIMGHSSVAVTERYAHLAPRAPEVALARADVDLTKVNTNAGADAHDGQLPAVDHPADRGDAQP